MAQIISSLNFKGGVGKTTVAVNLAAYLGRRGKRVLFVDLDPQFNASQMILGQSWYDANLTKSELKVKTVRDVFHADGEEWPQAIVRAYSHFIDIIPSYFTLSDILKHPYEKERKLQKYLSTMAGVYDYVFIDCSPTDSPLTTAAYHASNYVFIPTKPEFLSTIGLSLMLESLDSFKRNNAGKNLEIIGVLFNIASKYRGEYERSLETVRDFCQEQEWYFFKSKIEFSESYAKGARLAATIDRTPYARWDKISNFYSFAQEFQQRLEALHAKKSANTQ